jgi:hypothetical protein
VAELSELPSALGFTFSSMFTLSNVLTIWTPIILLIIVFICPHMHMSWADVKGATSGAVALITVAFLISLASAVIPDDVVKQVQGVMNTLVTYYIYALILGLIVSVFMTMCFGLMSLIRGKGL